MSAGICHNLLGGKVKLACKDGTYIGRLDCITAQGMITLKHVVCQETNSYQEAPMRFHKTEVLSTEMLEAPSVKTPENMPRRPERPLMRHKETPAHLKNRKEYSELEVVFGASERIKACVLPEMFTHTVTRRKDESLLPTSYIMCDTHEKMYVAIKNFVAQETTIGLSLEACQLGRKGTLSLVSVCTPSAVFLFDALALGEELFQDGGIAQILKDDKVTKVMHDSRLASDYLYHNHDIILKNVFDTVVADVHVFKQRRRGDLPRYTSALPSILVSHLGLDPTTVFYSRSRQGLEAEDESVWLQRPLELWLLDGAVKNNMYLLSLHKHLFGQMMAEFRSGVDLFLGWMRDARPNALDVRKCELHLVPFEMQQIRKKFESRFDEPKDQQGFVLNKQRVTDPSILYSKDSVWSMRDTSLPDRRVPSRFGRSGRVSDTYDGDKSGSRGVPSFRGSRRPNDSRRSGDRGYHSQDNNSPREDTSPPPLVAAPAQTGTTAKVGGTEPEPDLTLRAAGQQLGSPRDSPAVPEARKPREATWSDGGSAGEGAGRGRGQLMKKLLESRQVGKAGRQEDGRVDIPEQSELDRDVTRDLSSAVHALHVNPLDMMADLVEAPRAKGRGAVLSAHSRR